MICLQKPFYETNRIEAIGTWNNYFIFGNYFILCTPRKVDHIFQQVYDSP